MCKFQNERKRKDRVIATRTEQNCEGSQANQRATEQISERKIRNNTFQKQQQNTLNLEKRSSIT